MFLAPYGRYHGATVAIERDRGNGVSSSSLHRRDVEAEDIAAIVRTAYVEVRMALQA